MNLNNTRILAICSTVDFKNFTRRATLEAIYDQHPYMDLLLFNGIKAILKKKITSGNIPAHTYHKWLPGNFAETGILGRTERFLRKRSQQQFFDRYDILFLSDPNQFILLDYIDNEIPIIYLIRDPNVLQDPRNRIRERRILERADLVLATSQNLAGKYLLKYHGMEHPNIHYWPNCVDTDLWDPKIIENGTNSKSIIGVASHFSSQRTDYNLLKEIAELFPEQQIEIAGRIDHNENSRFWKEYLGRSNVVYKGFVYQDELPRVVARWNVGLVTDRINEYTSYMHHNKVYQYLAMGVPVVSLKIHDDYDHLHPYVQVAENSHDYITAISGELENSTRKSFQRECMERARNNSAQKRAHFFVKQMENLKKSDP